MCAAISAENTAGKWLTKRGADPENLIVFAAYRGNWEVMLRGLFTNRLARNYLAGGLGPVETVLEDGTVLPFFETAAYSPAC